MKLKYPDCTASEHVLERHGLTLGFTGMGGALPGPTNRFSVNLSNVYIIIYYDLSSYFSLVTAV